MLGNIIVGAAVLVAGGFALKASVKNAKSGGCGCGGCSGCSSAGSCQNSH